MLSLLRMLTAVSTVTLICSCLTTYPVIQVNPSGKVPGAVVFAFSDSSRGRVPIEITSIRVGEFYPTPDGGGVDRPRWDVSGNQTLRYAIYGARYSGLKQVGPVQSLHRGHRYTVYVLTAGGSHDLFAF